MNMINHNCKVSGSQVLITPPDEWTTIILNNKWRAWMIGKKNNWKGQWLYSKNGLKGLLECECEWRGDLKVAVHLIIKLSPKHNTSHPQQSQSQFGKVCNTTHHLTGTCCFCYFTSQMHTRAQTHIYKWLLTSASPTPEYTTHHYFHPHVSR